MDKWSTIEIVGVPRVEVRTRPITILGPEGRETTFACDMFVNRKTLSSSGRNEEQAAENAIKLLTRYLASV